MLHCILQAPHTLQPSRLQPTAPPAWRTVPMGLPCCHFVGEGPAAELPPALTHYGGPIFPELLEPGTQAVLVGVDPDINGAVAVLSWRNPPASAAGSSGTGDTSNSGDTSASASSTEWPAHLATEAVGVEVHDMPIEVWELGTRSKRQPHAAELIALLRQQLGLPGGGGEGGLWGSSGSSNGVGGGGSCKVVTRAVLEHTTPQHLSGKYAWCAGQWGWPGRRLRKSPGRRSLLVRRPVHFCGSGAWLLHCF